MTFDWPLWHDAIEAENISEGQLYGILAKSRSHNIVLYRVPEAQMSSYAPVCFFLWNSSIMNGYFQNYQSPKHVLWDLYATLRATSHTSQEPWPWKCESPKKVSKGSAKIPPKSCSAVTDPRVEGDVMCDRPSTNCDFNEFLFMRARTYDENRMNQRVWEFWVPWSSGFVLGLPPRGGFRK